MTFIYQILLKEVNGDQKGLSFPYIWYNTFDVLREAISLDKVKFSCTDRLVTNSTGNYSSVFCSQCIMLNKNGSKQYANLYDNK